MNAACLLSEEARKTVIDLFTYSQKDGIALYKGGKYCAFGVAFNHDGLGRGKEVPLTDAIIRTLREIAPENHPLLQIHEGSCDRWYTEIHDMLEVDIAHFISKLSLNNQKIVRYFEQACDE